MFFIKEYDPLEYDRFYCGIQHHKQAWAARRKAPNPWYLTAYVVSFSNNTTTVIGRAPPSGEYLEITYTRVWPSFSPPSTRSPSTPSSPPLTSALLGGLRARPNIPPTLSCFLSAARTTSSAKMTSPCGVISECSTLAPTLSGRCHSTSRISTTCVCYMSRTTSSSSA